VAIATQESYKGGMSYENSRDIQTIETSFLCPCGQPAVMTFGFPGEPVQGRCRLHEAGTSLRKEIEPGRTHVASVERFDE